MTTLRHVYEVRPRDDHRGVDLISDALPFGRLWYAEPNAISNAIGYAKFFSRSHDAVIRVYDDAGNVIETHEHAGDFKEPQCKRCHLRLPELWLSLRLVRPLDHAMHAIVERLRQHTAGQKLPPPASVADIAETEKRLGFRLPSLLRELYGMVADGSFGPPYGFLPLLTPVPESKLPNLSLPGRDSVVQLYTLFRGGDPEEPSWSWPERLLPVLEWGCAIRSCVDCSSPSLAVVRDEPYVSRITESPSLEQWLSDWMGGRDLWKIGAQ